MGLFQSVKDKGSRGNRVYQLCFYGALLCVLLILGVVFLDSEGAYNAAGRRLASGLERFHHHTNQTRVVRKSRVGNTFGTIFHNELVSYFGLTSMKPEAYAKLLATLQQMERTNIKTVLFSISWEFFAPNEKEMRWDYLNALVATACRNTKLKVGLAVDMLRAPDWLLRKYPDCHPMDAGGRNYSHLSWYHGAANDVALDMLRQVGGRMTGNFSGCVVSMQPVYNNEYEAKFTQEYDAYQDYSPYALAAFRDWLRSKRPDVTDLNSRWGTNFGSWPEVAPPAVLAGTNTGVEASARYWDWMRFREQSGAAVFNRGCATIQQAGLQCFHHFPEFFSVLDAVYSAPMFKHIAASPHTDFLVMDSNFMTAYRAPINPVKLRIYLASALPYGKPVYFEAAVDRYTTLDVLRTGFKHALVAGAPNLGITNWVNTIKMNSSLAGVMRGQRSCKASELVGVFIHMDSCMAWQGLQWHSKLKDPMHDFIESLAVRLTEKCGTDLLVYVEMQRFLADLPTFHRAVFVEPLVLYGNAEFETYMSIKSKLQHVPHEVLRLPTNSSRGLALKVLQDL